MLRSGLSLAHVVQVLLELVWILLLARGWLFSRLGLDPSRPPTIRAGSMILDASELYLHLSHVLVYLLMAGLEDEHVLRQFAILITILARVAV